MLMRFDAFRRKFATEEENAKRVFERFDQFMKKSDSKSAVRGPVNELQQFFEARTRTWAAPCVLSTAHAAWSQLDNVSFVFFRLVDRCSVFAHFNDEHKGFKNVPLMFKPVIITPCKFTSLTFKTKMWCLMRLLASRTRS